MTVLLTGANGFFGQYLKMAYEGKALETMGLSECDININIAECVPNLSNKYDTVIHAAGKAHIFPKSPVEKEDFYKVNVEGTKNLLLGLENTGYLPKILIFISTVAVYGKEAGWLIDEDHPKAGITPYAKSKIVAETLLVDWGARNGVETIIFRLPLLVGQSPPGNLGLMIKAIRKGYYFRIGDGSARRSMVLAEDVANFIASTAIKPGIYNLTDGYHPSIRDLEDYIALQVGKKIKTIPDWFTKFAARIGDLANFLPVNTIRLEKLTSTLTFSDKKARKEINWDPKPVIDSLIV